MSAMTDPHLSALNIGGLGGFGPGIAGDRSWVAAAAVVVVLAVLAWWTMRPARRASRSEILRARRRADRSKTSEAHTRRDRTKR